jgi:hypothetical protein
MESVLTRGRDPDCPHSQPPLAAEGDPHIVLDLSHVLFGGSLLGERPLQHEFGLEYGFCALHDAVEGGSHPRDRGMFDFALDIGDAPAGMALVPGAVEWTECPLMGWSGRAPAPHSVELPTYRIARNYCGPTHFRCLLPAALRRRTPGPPPFSSMNSTPAFSKARLMTSRVARRGCVTPASS